MSLIDLIEGTAGAGALQQIGARVGLSPDQVQSAIRTLAPVLGPKIAGQAETGNLDTQISNASAFSPGSSEAIDHGNDILGAVLGSKDASRSVANDASASTGIDVAKLKTLLPLVASVATSVIAAHRGHAADNDPSAGGGLMDSLGGLLGRLSQ